MTETRRFPTPWQIDETEACFIARDSPTSTLRKSPVAVLRPTKTRRGAVARQLFLAPIRLCAAIMRLGSIANASCRV